MSGSCQYVGLVCVDGFRINDEMNGCIPDLKEC